MKNKINPKSYTMLKFLLTLSLFGFYLIGFLAIIVAIKQNDQEENWFTQNYTLLSSLFIVISSFLALLYIALRTWIHKISGYSFNKKEKSQYIIWISLQGVIIFLAILIITSHLLSNQAFLIITIVCCVFMFILGIVISMLEIFSRLNEQALINQKWHDDIEIKEVNLKKEAKITQKLSENKNDNPFLED